MNYAAKIQRLLAQRGWSLYRLSKEAGLSPSTLHSMFHKGTNPTLPTLEAVCTAFDMTLVEFFTEEDGLPLPLLPPGGRELLSQWQGLSLQQRQALLALLEAFAAPGARPFSPETPKRPGT